MPSLQEMMQKKGKALVQAGIFVPKIQQIHYKKLKPSEMNFYRQNDILELADAILLTGGILQPLIVRKTDIDEYEILAGHRRRLANIMNVEQRGYKVFEQVPCIEIVVADYIQRIAEILEIEKDKIDEKEIIDIVMEYVLIVTNSTARGELSDYERMMEAMRLKKIMPYLVGSEELKGRALRLAIAKYMKKSDGTIGMYEAIYNNLIEPGKEKFKNGIFGITMAYKLSGIPQDVQRELLKQKTITEEDINQYKPQKKSEPQIEQPKINYLELTDENLKLAMKYVFGRAGFDKDVMCELVDVFRDGDVGESDYVARAKNIFDKVLPHQNDAVTIERVGGYKLTYTYSGEVMSVPLFLFWKTFAEYFKYWTPDKEDATELPMAAEKVQESECVDDPEDEEDMEVEESEVDEEPSDEVVVEDNAAQTQQETRNVAELQQVTMPYTNADVERIHGIYKEQAERVKNFDSDSKVLLKSVIIRDALQFWLDNH